jgi:hypothetical protein
MKGSLPYQLLRLYRWTQLKIHLMKEWVWVGVRGGEREKRRWGDVRIVPQQCVCTNVFPRPPTPTPYCACTPVCKPSTICPAARSTHYNYNNYNNYYHLLFYCSTVLRLKLTGCGDPSR